MRYRSYRRLLHSIDNHGVNGTVLRAVDKLFGKEGRNEIRNRPAALVHPFDVQHGVDTSGYLPGEQLRSGSSADLYNTAYYGIAPSALTQALWLLPSGVDTYTFLDLGCGKGRALLVAAQFPFRQIEGIELSPELCRIATENVDADPRITVRQGDATDLGFPPTPLLVYLYHPFLAPALRKMLTNLECSFKQQPREIYLLRANPVYPKMMRSFRFLQPVWDYSFPLSEEDAAADRHGIRFERFTLLCARPSSHVAQAGEQASQ